MLKWKYLLFIIFLSACDSDTVCIYANKDVTILNNTAYTINVTARDQFQTRTLGSISSFGFSEYNLPFNVLVEAGNSFFSSELFIDPCLDNYELIVEN